MGQSKRKSDVLLAKYWHAETEPCNQCGRKCGTVVQWRNMENGKLMRKYSIICGFCWNVLVREKTPRDAIFENNNMNHDLKREEEKLLF